MRKHAKDSGGDGGGGVEVETMEDGPDGVSLLLHSLQDQLTDPQTRQINCEGPENHNQIALGNYYHLFRGFEAKWPSVG